TRSGIRCLQRWDSSPPRPNRAGRLRRHAVIFRRTLVFCRDRLYAQHHSTRKAWDCPGEIRIVPPGGIPEGDAVRLAEVQPEKDTKAWHCPISLCASCLKQASTSATRRTAGTRR